MKMFGLIVSIVVYLLFTGAYFLWVLSDAEFKTMPLYVALLDWGFVIAAWGVLTYFFLLIISEF